MHNLRKLHTFGNVLLLVCTFLEVIFFHSLQDFFGCVTLFYGWNLINSVVLTEENFEKYFVVFVVFFGYAVCFWLSPLPVTLFEFKPLTFRFALPYTTFIHQTINVTMLVCAFKFSSFLYRDNLVKSMMKKWGYFRAPTPSYIWILGFIGLFCLLYSLKIQGTLNAEAKNLNATGQLIESMKNFVIAPVSLLFCSFWGRDYRVNKNVIMIYLVVVSIICIASTRRELMLSMFFIAAFMWFVNKLYRSKNFFSSKNAVFAIIVIFFVTGPVSDLANAMIASRSESYSVSSLETFDNILDLYFDKEKLHKTMKKKYFSNSDNNGLNTQAWSEYYVDNPLFDRFCNMRTIDISLDYAKKLGFDNSVMHQYVVTQVLILLPSPVLNFLGVGIDKFDNRFTPGDLMSTMVLRYERQYHGFRVAGDTAVGLFWLGYKYYAVAFVIYTILFMFFSCLTKMQNGRLIIPVPIIISLNDYILYFNNSTGIVRTIRYLLRQGWQNILLYCVLMFFIRFVFHMLDRVKTIDK